MKSLDGELVREDVAQLGSKPVAAPHHVFAVVVVVITCKQLAEYQTGDMHLLFFVHFDWNAFAIVQDGDLALFWVNCYLDSACICDRK